MEDNPFKVYFFGSENCKPGHAYGPGQRKVFLIHYVLAGKGKYQNRYGEWEIHAGQAFLIEPHQLASYQADESDPWQYTWIGFTGDEAEALLKKAAITSSNPLFEFDFNGNVSRLMAICEQKKAFVPVDSRISESILEDLLREILVSENRMVDIYFVESIRYIESHYKEKLTVEALAKHIGVNRSYLYSIYKERINLSPQEYIIYFRMSLAKKRLMETKMSIGEVALSVGYPDQLMFSKIFKKRMGMSPNRYRTEMKSIFQ